MICILWDCLLFSD